MENPDPDEPGGQPTDAAEIFQPDSESFKTINPLNQPKSAHAALLLSEDGPVVVAGGLDEAELYDVAAQNFSLLPPAGVSDNAKAASLLPEGTALITTMSDYAVFDPVVEAFELFEVDESLAPDFDTFDTAQVLLPQGRVLRLGDAGRLYLWSPEEPRMAPPIPMLHARQSPATVPLPTGNVLIVGDVLDAPSAGACASIFDPTTHTLRPTKGCPIHARGAPGATVLRDGRVLITGGAMVSETNPGTGPWPNLDSAELYHPDTEQFELVGPMRTARVGHGQVLLPDGKVLVTGGASDWEAYPTDAIEIFDPKEKAFQPAGQMAEPRGSPTATLLVTGEVLITGGLSGAKEGGPIDTAEIYDPQAPDQHSSLQMAQRRSWHEAIPLPDGRVLLAGSALMEPNNIYEVFDPIGRSFGTLRSSPVERVLPKATLLPSGKVLIAGGCEESGCNLPRSTTELFDPVLKTITESVPMTEPRWGCARTLLPDGSVLLAGGATLFAPRTFAVGADVWRETPVEEAFRPVLDPIRTTNPTGLAAVTAGTTVTLQGHGFTGVSEASSGQSPSPTDHPVVMWMPLNGVPTTGTTVEWTDTMLKWKVPPTSYPGPGYLFVAVNGVRSKWRLVTVLPAANGAPCEYRSQCASGYCVEGMCCDQPCDGTCMSCRGADSVLGEDGACSPVRPGIQWSECEAHDVDECDTNGECDGAGHCAIYPEGTRCYLRSICMGGRCLPGCNVHGDCGDGWMCMADGTCAPMFEDDEPGCTPACAVGKRRRGVSDYLALLLLGGLWRTRRRQARIGGRLRRQRPPSPAQPPTSTASSWSHSSRLV